MNKNYFAVMLGFDTFADPEHLPKLSFAEKDADDVFRVLTDSCQWPAENLLLIQGKNSKNSKDAIERALYSWVVKARTPADTVLVYYSGHGFIAGDSQKAYLATPDVTIANILDNPQAGLSMQFLHDEIFMATKAQYAIFLLDCCHSGAFCPNVKGDPGLDRKELVGEDFFSKAGRAALVSSPRGVASRESLTYKNGVFTHWLLEGLGGAAESHSKPGLVTFESLADYVQGNVPPSQQAIVAGTRTRIVLARLAAPQVPVAQAGPSALGTEFHGFVTHDALPNIKPLPNPIDKPIDYTERLLRRLEALPRDDHEGLRQRLLDAIRLSVEADLVLVEHFERDNMPVNRLRSESDRPNMDWKECRVEVLSGLYNCLVQENSELLPMRFGFSSNLKYTKGGGDNVIAIPLQIEYPRDFLILCGVPASGLELGEILGHTLISVYRATREFTSLSMENVENAIWDRLRQDFGTVPQRVYNRRFKLFTNYLGDIKFSFEPVVRVPKNRRRIQIDSWEALARNPATDHAPYDLFRAAELWGAHFTTELDLFCLANAVHTYQELWKKERGDKELDLLSVNVYPETLFRSVYKREIKKITQQEADWFDPHKLVLEISEKRPIQFVDRTVDDDSARRPAPEDRFLEELFEYTKDYSIAFAIDDFGVEHASIARLAALKLDHVKIDRGILRMEHPELTLKFVMDIVQQRHPGLKRVVVEGFDEDSKLSLREMFDLGIEYFQGHLVRRAERRVSDLEEDRKTKLLDLLE